MRKFIHIRSKIPAIISINGEPIKHNNPDIMCTTDFYIAFFPTTHNNYLPCAISTNNTSHHSAITQIPYNDNHIEIFYNPTPLPIKTTEHCMLSKKYNNFNITITNSNQSYISILSTTFQHTSTTQKLEGIVFKSFDGYILITGHNDSNQQYLLIFNTKTKKVIIESLFSNIEMKKNEIKALKQDKYCNNYGTIYTFDFNTKKLTHYNVYTSKSHPSKTKEIIPFQFLKSIQYEDYSQSLKLLENTDATPEKLKQFFGNIQEIYFNGYSKDINYTILSDLKYRNFTFHIANNKIVDIEENPL